MATKRIKVTNNRILRFDAHSGSQIDQEVQEKNDTLVSTTNPEVLNNTVPQLNSTHELLRNHFNNGYPNNTNCNMPSTECTIDRQSHTNSINNSTLNITQILRVIPEYDGNTETIYEFIDSIKDFENLIEKHDVNLFIGLLKYKITKNARRRISRRHFVDIDDFIIELKKTFTPYVTVSGLLAETCHMLQSENESAADYGCRIGNTLNKTLNIIKLNESSSDFNVVSKFITQNSIECFINGSRNRNLFLYTTGLTKLQDVIDIAIKLENRHEHYNKIHGLHKTKVNPAANITLNYRTNVYKPNSGKYASANTHNQQILKNRKTNNNNCFRCGIHGHVKRNCKVKICDNCKKHGHTIKECRARICGRCQNRGHSKEECKSKFCEKCNIFGHTVEICYNRFIKGTMTNK